MNTLSSILRIFCGLALIALSISVHDSNSVRIASGAPAEVFGFPTGASGGQLTLAMVVVGLIGLLLILLGIAGFLKKRH